MYPRWRRYYTHMTEERLVQIMKTAEREWDLIHGDGWNEAYVTQVPTCWHLVARRILEELGSDHVASTV